MSKNKARNVLRRSQLIAPFGVGSLLTQEDGTSVVICGLDFWLPRDVAEQSALEIKDTRLKERLRVSKLYRPPTIIENLDVPDFRAGQKPEQSVPVLRFPTYYSCKSCGKIGNRSQNFHGKVECSHNSSEGKSYSQEMFQVPYVIMCEDGHLNDFPWRQWVHKSVSPNCEGDLFLKAATSGNLQNSIVTCGKCNAFRAIASAMSKTSTRSNLTLLLDENRVLYTCGGWRPWLGDLETNLETCGKEVWAAFRGAGNVYFPNVESSILIPESTKKLEDLCESLNQLVYIHPRNKFKLDPQSAVDSVKDITKTICIEYGIQNWLENSYTDRDIFDALASITGDQVKLDAVLAGPEKSIDESSRTHFLHKEFVRLQMPSTDDRLAIRIDDMPYGDEVSRIINQVLLVTSLTETRAFWGFSRVEPQRNKSYFTARKMLRRYKTAPGGKSDWLPAVQVRGEGLFFTFDYELLAKWASQNSVKSRFDSIQRYQDNFYESDNGVTPIYVLLHTLSHLLIKELTFFCGYGQASLQERLYVSSDEDTKMAGILIYTASGDSEGTLGGLVRMGKPGYLEEVVSTALEKAMWCSNDPVCSESADGQGASGESPASCYACTLLPETSCESFNRQLDRGLVIGVPSDSSSSFLEFVTK